MNVDTNQLKYDDIVSNLSQLRSEQEIMANWEDSNAQPLVSISCITYNHASYIEDALKGFLIQETNFAFEILIHDDASTDQTANIIREYEKRYPKIIKPIYQIENKYSQGIAISPNFNYPRAQGDYIAVCEGDDYWTAKNKLQLQVQKMKANPEYSMCFHPAFRIDEQTGDKVLIGCYATDSTIISVEDIIEKKHGQIPTASTMFSSKVIPLILEYFQNNKVTVGDIYLHFITASFGNGALFIPETMSTYRFDVPGSWNNRVNKNSHLIAEHIVSRIKSYSTLNADTDRKYKQSLMKSSFLMYKNFLIHGSSLEEKVRTYPLVMTYFSYPQRLILLSILKLNFLIPTLKNVKNKARDLRSNFRI